METALGTVVMITATALFFDVYQLTAGKHSLLHDAISVGDYVEPGRADILRHHIKPADIVPAQANLRSNEIKLQQIRVPLQSQAPRSTSWRTENRHVRRGGRASLTT